MCLMYGLPSTGKQTTYFPFLGAMRGVVVDIVIVYYGGGGRFI